MTTAYFDCFSGISGDMTLGALVDLGVPFDELKAALKKLPVEGYVISSKSVARCGIGGTQVTVTLTDSHHDHGHDHEQAHSHGSPLQGEHDHSHDHSHDHGHSHEHSHNHGHSHEDVQAHAHHHDEEHDHSHTHPTDHDHNHSHEHSPDSGGEQGHHHHAPHRGFSEIKGIIDKSDFSPWVKSRSIDAFHRIAVEEAAVHQTTIEEVHFHEVGAVDAIVDIVGSMWCLERLGVTRVLASAVAVGSGTIHVAHGEMPIPAPATARLLRGKPICTGPVSGELATPTGAAIITTLAENFGPLQDFAVDKIGYGAGRREYPTHTNYLRVFLGETNSQPAQPTLPLITETLVVLSAEIDDMPGEHFGHVLDKMFEAGALDCHFVPVQMKKNRPATSLHVLCDAAHQSQLVELIFRETTTFGIKSTPCTRFRLERKWEPVETPWGRVRVKIALWGDEELKRSPEYEDCRRIAEESRVPLAEIYQAAMSASRKG